MPGVAPGANSRGRGGKFKKFTRGGGKHFSRDLRPVDSDGNEISMWSAEAQNKRSSDENSEEDSDEDSEEESSEGEGSAAKQQGAAANMTREERKQATKDRKLAALAKKKAREVKVGDLPSDSEEEDDDDADDADMPANPNHSKAARNQTKPPAVEADVDGVTDGVKKLAAPSGANRKERESAEAALAKEKYRQLHEQGKTDEAKADLARLKLIREQRAADAARKQAEKEEREEREKERRAEFDAKEAKKREAALGKKGAKKSK